MGLGIRILRGAGGVAFEGTPNGFTSPKKRSGYYVSGTLKACERDPGHWSDP